MDTSVIGHQPTKILARIDQTENRSAIEIIFTVRPHSFP